MFFQLNTARGEFGFIGLGSALGFALRDQEITAIAILDLDDVAKTAQIRYFFQQNNLHGGPLVLVGVRQEREEARTLHGSRKLTLIARLGAGDAGWNNLAVFVDEIFQQIYILVVHFLDAFCRKTAVAAALEHFTSHVSNPSK